LLAAVARLHVTGVSPDWRALLGEGRRVDLPTYAFQRERFWIDAPATGDVTAAGLAAADHPLLGAAVGLAGSGGVVCTGRLSVRTHPWLADHVIGGAVVVPGTALLELVIRAGDQAGCSLVEELTLETPLVLPERGAVQVQVVVGVQDERGARPVAVYSRIDDGSDETEWTRHADGVLATGERRASSELTAWPPTGAEPIEIESLYEDLAGAGLAYGPVFRGLRAAWRRGEEVFAEVTLAEAAAREAGRYGLHPAALDAGLHVLGLVASDRDGSSGQEAVGRLPFSWTGVSLHAAGASSIRLRLSPADRDGIAVEVADAAGRPVASVEALVARPVSAERMAGAVAGARTLYQMRWGPAETNSATASDLVWAWIGDGTPGDGASSYPDLAALAGEIGSGGAVPDAVVVRVEGVSGGTDVPAVVRAVTDRVLGLVQEWLAEERFA
ncbi:polyketide synthase dehydratase domain-containing protein, partial [Planomonospora alba]|uniref:polyketide synthase dehydratase domain-containing protein n=1 Tax=Planomonospora alba TaxID=161354 RepID=UPI0031EA87AB